jgi:hypothetical protein
VGTVIVQVSIRRRASGVELIPAPPTQEELSAAEARRDAVIKAWEANPSDPNRIESRHCNFCCVNSGG